MASPGSSRRRSYCATSDSETFHDNDMTSVASRMTSGNFSEEEDSENVPQQRKFGKFELSPREIYNTESEDFVDNADTEEPQSIKHVYINENLDARVPEEKSEELTENSVEDSEEKSKEIPKENSVEDSEEKSREVSEGNSAENSEEKQEEVTLVDEDDLRTESPTDPEISSKSTDSYDVVMLDVVKDGVTSFIHKAVDLVDNLLHTTDNQADAEEEAAAHGELGEKSEDNAEDALTETAEEKSEEISPEKSEEISPEKSEENSQEKTEEISEEDSTEKMDQVVEENTTADVHIDTPPREEESAQETVSEVVDVSTEESQSNETLKISDLPGEPIVPRAIEIPDHVTLEPSTMELATTPRDIPSHTNETEDTDETPLSPVPGLSIPRLAESLDSVGSADSDGSNPSAPTSPRAMKSPRGQRRKKKKGGKKRR